MVNTAVTLCGLPLENPVIPASGTFGYGYEFAQIYDINCLGTFSFKGTTLTPRYGNPTPRIAEYAGGLLNSVGLQNPGVEAVIREELPRLREVFHKPVMANVCGFSVDEYVEVAAKLDRCPEVGWLEINISCPNVKQGGLAFGIRAKDAEEVVSAVRKVCTVPLVVKLSPQAESIPDMCKAVEAAGADGISLCNTFQACAIDLEKRRPVFNNTFAGLSGPAIRPIALRMVWQAVGAVNIPVIGLGGILTGRDALEFIMAGAAAVQVGTANFLDPKACTRITAEIGEWMDAHGVKTLDEIRGCARG